MKESNFYCGFSISTQRNLNQTKMEGSQNTTWETLRVERPQTSQMHRKPQVAFTHCCKHCLRVRNTSNQSFIPVVLRFESDITLKKHCGGYILLACLFYFWDEKTKLLHLSSCTPHAAPGSLSTFPVLRSHLGPSHRPLSRFLGRDENTWSETGSSASQNIVCGCGYPFVRSACFYLCRRSAGSGSNAPNHSRRMDKGRDG